MSDTFVNPAYIGGQAQNLTGPEIPPGGTIGFSSGSSAIGDGGVAPTASPLSQRLKVQVDKASPAVGFSGVNDYFVRAIIVILGFILVATGLSMFRQTSPLAIPAH